MKFIDDKCTIHDLSAGDTIVASCLLCHGLYKLNAYDMICGRCSMCNCGYVGFIRCKTMVCTFWAFEFCQFDAFAKI